MEGRKGMIRKGYLGDVVVFNDDLMTILHDRIMSAKVDHTIVAAKSCTSEKEQNERDTTIRGYWSSER